jgi:hypothetical protein
MARHPLRLPLLLMGSLVPGLAQADPSQDDASIIPEATEVQPAQGALAADPTWQDLVVLWQEAAAIGSGERGAFPFDRAGKEALLAKLEASKAQVHAIQARGLLSAPEASLLRADVDTIVRAVQGKRPTEMEMATCYKPMMVTPTRDSAQRIEQRLPLLEQLAGEGVLHPEVVERVLQSVEADISTILGGSPGHQVEPGELETMQQTAQAAQAHIATIRARLEEQR